MKPQTKATILFLFLAIIFGSATLWLAGCSQSERAQGEQLYTCGMHPQVIQDKPGNCSICGMKLTPIRKQGPSPSTSTSGAQNSGERKEPQYYKSTMTAGETSAVPRKDSMGMDMVPVYE